MYPFCPGWIQYWSGSCHLYWFHARICTAPQWWSPPGWSGRAQGIEYTLKFLLRHFCNWRMLAKWWKTVLVWRWRSKGIDYPLALRRRQFDRWRMARYGGSTPRRILPLSPISATWMTAMVFRLELYSCACCSEATVTSISHPSFVSLRGNSIQTNARARALSLCLFLSLSFSFSFSFSCIDKFHQFQITFQLNVTDHVTVTSSEHPPFVSQRERALPAECHEFRSSMLVSS